MFATGAAGQLLVRRTGRVAVSEIRRRAWSKKAQRDTRRVGLPTEGITRSAGVLELLDSGYWRPEDSSAAHSEQHTTEASHSAEPSEKSQIELSASHMGKIGGVSSETGSRTDGVARTSILFVLLVNTHVPTANARAVEVLPSTDAPLRSPPRTRTYAASMGRLRPPFDIRLRASFLPSADCWIAQPVRLA